MSLNVDDVVGTDKKHMSKLFNHHFIKSGFLFDSAMPPQFVLYLKGEIKLILTVTGLFLFCPVY